MKSWRINTAELSFAVPGKEVVDHLSAETSRQDECLGWFADGRGDGTWQEDPDRVGAVTHRVWWWRDDDCPGDFSCACGRLTLLEALERLGSQERGIAVRLHAAEMRALYDHFWSGQGLVSGACSNIGDACVGCLTEGAAHVWDVYESACLLAEEFGEALAAYAYELLVGEPRFHPLGDGADDQQSGG